MKKRLCLWAHPDYLKPVIDKVITVKGDEAEVTYVLVEGSKEVNLAEGIKVVSSLDDYVTDYKKGNVDGIVISAAFCAHTQKDSVQGRYETLMGQGVRKSDIFVIPATLEWMPVQNLVEQEEEDFFSAVDDFSEPFIVKFLAYEGCNLNCSGCTHFSPLNKSPKMLSVGECSRDLKRLKEIFKYIRFINFLGGEPLLNPHLDELIDIAREEFPYSDISAITNGLLLPKLQEKVWASLERNRVEVQISMYEPTMDIIDDVKAELEKRHIRYLLSGKIKNFRLQYNTKGSQDQDEQFNNCLDSRCHTIIDGKIGGCYYACLGKIANDVFGLNIPSEEYLYDLYTGGTKVEQRSRTA